MHPQQCSIQILGWNIHTGWPPSLSTKIVPSTYTWLIKSKAWADHQDLRANLSQWLLNINMEEKKQDASFDRRQTFGSRWKSPLKLQTPLNHCEAHSAMPVFTERRWKSFDCAKSIEVLCPRFLFFCFLFEYWRFICNFNLKSSTEGTKINLKPSGIPC